MAGTQRQQPGRELTIRQAWPRQPDAPTASGPRLRAGTGLSLAACGAILLLAVHGHLAFVDLQVAGVILLLAGGTWLWLPVRDKRKLLRRHFDRAMAYLDSDAAGTRGRRCSLSDLLQEGEPAAGTAATPSPSGIPAPHPPQIRTGLPRRPG